MPHVTCPQCHSELEDDFVESSGRSECPFCGAEISQPVAFPTDSTSAGGEQILLPPAPPKSILKVIEATAQRRVIYIPGGRAGSIGCFALLWNGFMVVFTSVFIGSMIHEKEGWGEILGISAFLSLFWIIGLGMAIWWVKAKYERLFLLLEPERLAIQRILFGRKRMKKFDLTPTSRAELVEAYQQNDNPVYRIEVAGSNGTAKFGTALDPNEKNWLVDRINEFLHPLPEETTAAPPKFCSQCGAKLEPAEPGADEIHCRSCGQVIPLLGDDHPAARDEEDLDDAEIPQPPELDIEVQTADHLRFALPSCSNPVLGWVIVGVTLLFGGFFTIGALSFMLDFKKFELIPTLFAIPFLLGGLVPISVGLFFLRGRITVDVTRESLAARYHLGIMGFTKRVPIADISGVQVKQGESHNSRIRHRRSRSKSDMAACVVQAGAKSIPLTLVHEKETARYVTQLVRRQLRGMGVEV